MTEFQYKNAVLQLLDLVSKGVADITASPLDVNASFTASGGAESLLNSTATPLLAGATFTGEAISILDYGAINVAVISDVDSAVNGLKMQFSNDGVNWDHEHTYSITANTGISYNQAAEMKYFRVVYVNGATNQTFFRLNTILKTNDVSPSRYTVEQAVKDGQMADIVKGVIYGKTTAGGGSYIAVKVNPSGALATEATVIDAVTTTTPGLLRATAAGTITQAVYSFSVANVGAAAGVILGTAINAGETLSFDAGGVARKYAANSITYDGTGTELLIIYNY